MESGNLDSAAGGKLYFGERKLWIGKGRREKLRGQKIILLLVAAGLLAQTGCGQSGSVEKARSGSTEDSRTMEESSQTAQVQSRFENPAIEYISVKYQRVFTDVVADLGAESGDSGGNTDAVELTGSIVYCYTDDMDPKQERVTIYCEEQGDEILYRDNYFGFYIQSEAEDYVREMVEQEFPEAEVIWQVPDTPFPNELTCERGLADLYALDEDYCLEVIVYVEKEAELSEAEFNQKVQRAEQALAKGPYRCQAEFVWEMTGTDGR